MADCEPDGGISVGGNVTDSVFATGRNNRVVVVRGLLVAVVLAILAAGGTGYYLHQRTAAEQVERERAAAAARAEREQAVAAATAEAESRLIGRLVTQLGAQRAEPEVVAALTGAIGAVAAQAAQPDPPEGARAALDALAEGDTAKAEALFRDTLQRKAAEGAAANREAAEAARHLGTLAFLDDTEGALAAYRQAVALDPDDVWTWIFIGRLEARLGRLEAAEAAFTEARRRADAAGAERDVMAADNELGDVAMASGALPAAGDRYRSALGIAEKLASADPGNAEWQRDLTVSYIKIGDVLVAQGDGAAALASYRDGLAIREKLASADPGNAEWQRDLFVSYWRLADVAEKAGDKESAIRHFRLSLGVIVALRDGGRMAPVDAPWIAILERRIQALTGQAAD